MQSRFSKGPTIMRPGSARSAGANLLSYLLFDPSFCRSLLRLGYDDTLARRDELTAFLDERRTNFLPFGWPSFG